MIKKAVKYREGNHPRFTSVLPTAEDVVKPATFFSQQIHTSRDVEMMKKSQCSKSLVETNSSKCDRFHSGHFVTRSTT